MTGPMNVPKALVVGSGVMGLQTALELLKRNIPVVLRSTYPPLHPSTCSQGSGALWTPYKCDDVRVSGIWAMETLEYLLTCHSYNIERVPTLHLKKSFSQEIPEWTKDSRLHFEQLSLQQLYNRNSQHKLLLRLPHENEVREAGYTHAWFFHPPVVNAPEMLQTMLHQISSHPLTNEKRNGDNKTWIDVDTRYSYSSIQDMVQHAHQLECNFIMNCTGYGSSVLCQDSALQAGRGILLHYDRKTCRHKKSINEVDVQKEDSEVLQDVAIFVEELPWATSNESCYIIPRGDVLLVGGSFHLINHDKIDHPSILQSHERERLIQNASRFGIDTTQSKPSYEWIGYRPWRPTVRVELEYEREMPIIHNYGHGGSGWTVYVGAVKEAVELAMKSIFTK